MEFHAGMMQFKNAVIDEYSVHWSSLVARNESSARRRFE
jgi:hypothetical protein